MALDTCGMLFVASDIDPADEHDFNLWYDREHIAERVKMDGVISAARYISIDGGPKYLSLYWAESLGTFASPAYSHAFRHQTAWSERILPKMRAPTRRIGEISASVGQGSGGWVAVLPLETAADAPALHQQCAEVGFRLSAHPGFVHSYVLTPDDALSRPLPQEDLGRRRMRPLFLIESSGAAASETLVRTALSTLPCDPADAARYALTWKLAATEMQ